MIYDFITFYENQVAAYQAEGNYPMNGPVEIRVTGLDVPSDVMIASATTPQLSALRPQPDQPDWDVAVWFDILTMPGTPTSDQFYQDIEQWMFTNYTGSYAAVRPEWSKGWAYTDTFSMVQRHNVEHHHPRRHQRRAEALVTTGPQRLPPSIPMIHTRCSATRSSTPL